MEIRKATPADMPEILEIFGRARAFMAASGNPNQWVGGYPQQALMAAEIARGVCYLCVAAGRAEGTFCYIPGVEPTYATIEAGAWPDDAPYATIHRLASAGRVKGVAAACFGWAAAGGLALRADTHHDNTVMQHLLETNGFARCGQIRLANGSPRIAYWCRAETPPQNA
ncbi:MAG: N-acetyltransferase [Gemmiger sp.]|nr:N-acetyltransferase [Gemmiger sp.]